MPHICVVKSNPKHDKKTPKTKLFRYKSMHLKRYNLKTQDLPCMAESYKAIIKPIEIRLALIDKIEGNTRARQRK